MAIANGSQGDSVLPGLLHLDFGGGGLLLGGPARRHYGDGRIAIVIREHLLEVIELL